MDLKRPILYIDAIQAESRALISLCALANIDFETRDFKQNRNNQQITEEFRKINPSLTIPFMQAEINVGGAHAIAKYLCDTRLPESNSFYPSVEHDLARR